MVKDTDGRAENEFQGENEKMRGFQIANWVLTIASVVLLTFSFTRDEDRWLFFALTLLVLGGAVLSEYMRHRAYKAEQQRRVAQQTGG